MHRQTNDEQWSSKRFDKVRISHRLSNEADESIKNCDVACEK